MLGERDSEHLAAVQVHAEEGRKCQWQTGSPDEKSGKSQS
jgi:hypothetical protein